MSGPAEGADHPSPSARRRGRSASPAVRRRLGLRASITFAFALGALIVSALLAGGTFLVTRHYLIEQRQGSALRQAYADASLVSDGLRTSGVTVSAVLASVGAPSGSELVVHADGRWYSTSLEQGPGSIPDTVRQGVSGGSVSYVWTSSSGDPAIVIGVPLMGGAEYYEVSITSELADTLRTLVIVLTAFALVSTAVGALLGRFASAQMMKPLDDVAAAAARIGAGGLQTRLPQTDDPDLATIVGSFNSMVEALDERIQRDARFAADLGHELRSPLTTLVASVELIERRRDELPARTQRAVDLVSVELARFQQTLEDLLELGRLDAGVRGQVLTHVDVAELVRETLSTSRRDPGLLSARDAAAQHDPGSGPEGSGFPVVLADKNQLSRTVVNLLDNADRHGGGVTAVRVSRWRDRVRIDVEDGGSGVAPGDRERIFERFVRGGSRGSLPGSGLGLSIVAETAAAHGGRTWCEDADTGGARFVIELPAAAEAVPDDGSDRLASQTPPPSLASAGGGARGGTT